MEYRLFDFRTDADKIATRGWYVQSKGWDCDCGHCRNFLTLARERKLPLSVLEILDNLGIAPEKATYVCEIYHDGGGLLYQFSYRIAGRILSGDETALASREWGQGRCCHETYPYGAPDFPEPHFDLEFWLTLPWVLNEPVSGLTEK